MEKRIKVGISLFALFVFIAWIDIFWLNFILFGAILGIGFTESLKLYKIENRNLVLIPLVFYTFLIFANDFSDIFKIFLLNLTLIAAILAYIKSENLNVLLPFIYPVLPFFMLFGLYKIYGMSVFVWLLFIVIASDSGAYFVGRKFGKTFFSHSSPKKTLEGVLGGVFVAVLVGMIYSFIFLEQSLSNAILIPLLVAIFGVFGDLFESYLKRNANVKDSGDILGEQGGILDRFDGYLFGIVAFYLVLPW